MSTPDDATGVAALDSPVPKPRPRPRPRGRNSAPSESSEGAHMSDAEQEPVSDAEAAQGDTTGTDSDAAPPPPLPTREGRKPLEEEKKKIRVRRRPNKLKEKPTRPPPPAPGPAGSEPSTPTAAATTPPAKPPAPTPSSPTSDSAPSTTATTTEPAPSSSSPTATATTEEMYENVDDTANAIQRMSRLRQSQTQGDYVAPVDPVVPTAAPPPRPNRRPPPTINDTTPADKDADNAGDGGDDGDGVGDGNGGVRTATTHGPSTADGGELIYDDGVEMSKNDKAAAAAEAATTADEKSGDGDADSTSATETQKASAATDAGGDRAAQSDGDGDDDANPPAPPAPYKAEDEEQSESQSQPQSPADLVSPKMKKKRSWPNLFGRKQKAADSNEEAEFLSKVKGDSATMGVAIASKAVTKTKSTNYLTLAPNEKLDILEMKACPRGTWVCKNASGMIGFVMTTDVTLDAQSVRGFLDAIPKPQRAQVSAEGLPIETLSSSAGINVLPTEQCQIKAKQASEATQRLLGTPGGASDSDKAEGDGDGDGDGGGDGEDDGAEAKAESGEKEGEEASSDATATAAATEDEASGDKQTDSDQQKSSDEDTSEANTDSATDTTTKRAPSPGYDRLAFPAKGGSGSGGVNGDGGGDGDSEAIPEDTYAVPDELTGAEPSGLMYDDTPITAPGADDMYEAVTDALGSAPSTQPPPVPAPRKQSEPVMEPFYAQPTESKPNTATGADAGDGAMDEEEVYACMDDANIPTAQPAVPSEDVYLAMDPRKEEEVVYEDPAAAKDKRGAYENVTLPFQAAKPKPRPRKDQPPPRPAAPDLPPRKEE